ncbi:hypothetical protein FAK_33860 [Desulfoferula mesophila]|uniref:Uncharacterized protein n=1 Tax=Desulfoferula mesophila TaxID=3058419 RepID=A0AAU9EHT5_9BACT|nr:hypothetical protein FAK_33860 [Desulfoferula mesophilus]
MVLDEPKENDDKYEVDGLTYLIDKDLSSNSGKITVDFVDNGWQQGFTVNAEKPLVSEGDSCSTSGGCSSCGH